MTTCHVQRLRPDACACVFTFSMDLDADDPESTLEIVEFEQRCKRHKRLKDRAAYEAIVKESEQAEG